MSKIEKPSSGVVGKIFSADDVSEEEQLDLRQLRRELASARQGLSRYRAKYALLHDALMEIHEKPVPIKIPKLVKPRKGAAKEKRIAVLHVSDTQLGKETISYNMDKARARLLSLASKVAYITNDLRRAYEIDELKLYLGGDLVEGERIFRHQAHEIDHHLLDQAVRIGPNIFVEMILALSAHFPKVTVKAVKGNHGRDDFAANPATNWDTVCADVVQRILLGSTEYPRTELEGRVTMDVAPGWYIVDRMPGGWGNLLVHGDQIRGGFAGFPWYGAGRKASGWYQVIDEPFDYIFFGHFHTPAMATVNRVEFRANGTTESDNDYARAELAAQGHPTQRLCFYNEEYGLVDDQLIYLADPGVRRPTKVRFNPA